MAHNVRFASCGQLRKIEHRPYKNRLIFKLKTKMEKETQTPQLPQDAVISRFLCDECGWIGTREDCTNEYDFGYDQSCCPECNNVMFDNLHGNDYAEKVG